MNPKKYSFKRQNSFMKTFNGLSLKHMKLNEQMLKEIANVKNFEYKEKSKQNKI